MSLKDDVQAVRKFLTKERWIQGTLARNKDGVDVEPRGPEAVQFCMLGAAYHVCRDNLKGRTGAFHDKVSCIVQHMPRYDRTSNTTTFNDDPRTTYEDIMAMLDQVERCCE
jgi:hypothetical protein